MELSRVRAENARLRMENEILKKATAYFAKGDAVKYAWMEGQRKDYTLHEMCASPGGERKRLSGLEARRHARSHALTDRADAGSDPRHSPRHIKGAMAARGWSGSCGGAGSRPARKRVERLMREHGIRARHKRRYKVTTDSKHDLPVAANLLNRDFTPPPQTRRGHRTSPTCGRMRAGCIWRSCWTCSTAKWSAGR